MDSLSWCLNVFCWVVRNSFGVRVIVLGWMVVLVWFLFGVVGLCGCVVVGVWWLGC